MTTERKARRTMQGLVTSDAMEKTIVVTVTSLVMHPVVKKYVKHHTKLKAHDEENKAKAGDIVEVMECRPYSKTKHWRLVRVLGVTS